MSDTSVISYNLTIVTFDSICIYEQVWILNINFTEIIKSWQKVKKRRRIYLIKIAYSIYPCWQSLKSTAFYIRSNKHSNNDGLGKSKSFKS